MSRPALEVADTADSGNRDASATTVCPDCGAAMIIIETFERGQLPAHHPTVATCHEVRTHQLSALP